MLSCFSHTFFLANVNFFLSRRSRSPNVWIITIGIFPRPSATLPLHCINYRIGINLAARSGDRSTRIRNSLTSRLNQSFILHTWHIVYMKTKRGECIPWCSQKYLSVAVFSAETKRIWNNFTGNTRDQREFYSLWSTRYYWSSLFRRDM